MRITYSARRDTAVVYLSDEKQGELDGYTELVLANDEANPLPESVAVQLGFSGDHRLHFVQVRPASYALPADLLRDAEQLE